MPKLNIYIVEDDPFVATMLVQTIYGLGYQVCGLAASASAAIDGLQHISADLVITDIMLNGYKAGIELGNYIKANLHIPFIFQTTVTDAPTIAQAFMTGASAIMSKPANKQKLWLAINSAVKVLV